MTLPAIRTGALPGMIIADPYDSSLSFALSVAIEAAEKPHEDIGVPSAYQASVQAEARALLEQIAPFAQPVTQEALREWIAPIGGAVRNPLDKERIKAWWPGFWLAMRDLECGAFTERTQAQLLRACQFFPAVADVYAVVSGPAHKVRQRVATLQRIIAAPTKQRSAA